MKLLIDILLFAARHFLVVLLAMALGCIAWTVLYMILLVIGMVLLSDPGGPLTYPAGIFVIILACALIGWGIFAPACGAGRLACRIFALPKLAGIPITFITAGAIGYAALWASIPSTATEPLMGPFLFCHFAFLSLPLGLQWWLTEGPGALYELLKKRVLGRLHGMRNHTR